MGVKVRQRATLDARRAQRIAQSRPWRTWSRGEWAYRYGIYQIGPWDGKDAKPRDPAYEELEPLRVYYDNYQPPLPWRYRLQFPASVNGTYTSFYNALGVEQAKQWLDGAIKAVEEALQDVHKGMPRA